MGTKLFYGCQVVLFFHNNLQQNVTMFRRSPTFPSFITNTPYFKKINFHNNLFDIIIYIRIRNFALYNRLFTAYYACQR